MRLKTTKYFDKVLIKRYKKRYSLVTKGECCGNLGVAQLIWWCGLKQLKKSNQKCTVNVGLPAMVERTTCAQQDMRVGISVLKARIRMPRRVVWIVLD